MANIKNIIFGLDGAVTIDFSAWQEAEYRRLMEQVTACDNCKQCKAEHPDKVVKFNENQQVYLCQECEREI